MRTRRCRAISTCFLGTRLWSWQSSWSRIWGASNDKRNGRTGIGQEQALHGLWWQSLEGRDDPDQENDREVCQVSSFCIITWWFLFPSPNFIFHLPHHLIFIKMTYIRRLARKENVEGLTVFIDTNPAFSVWFSHASALDHSSPLIWPQSIILMLTSRHTRSLPLQLLIA